MVAYAQFGGPEPADGGHLNIVRCVLRSNIPFHRIASLCTLSVYSGTTTGNVKLDFGQAERDAMQDYIYPIFTRFMKKCFSKLYPLLA